MKKENLRITELDALRGIAAISVVFFHYTTNYRKKLGYNFSDSYDFDYGHYGVQLFFIISGFVIFMSLHHVKSVKEFIFKRFLRLFPTYWFSLCLTIAILLALPIPGYQFTIKEILFNFTMFQGIFNIRNVDGSYWSLLPELIFYIQMAIVYKFGFLNKIKYISIIWLVLIFLSTLRPSLLDMLLNLRFGMLFLAGIMFFRIRFQKDSILEHVFIVISLISTYFVKKDFEELVITTFIFLVFYLFIYGKLTFLNSKILLFLGFISYPLYLIHQSIGYVIIYNLKSIGVNEFISIILALLFCLFCAWIIAKYVEKFLVLKIKKLVA